MDTSVRLFACPVIGTGTEDDPYRPVCSGLVSGWSKHADTEDGVIVRCAPTPTERTAILEAGCVEVEQ
jgi:hypothetical protein